ncbi:MAG: magnesium transporter [Candidatus Thermoplasmatota archaeon]
MIYNWKKIVKTSMPLLTLCTLVEIVAGQLLQSWESVLLLFPLFLVSIPVINGVGGNIGSVLGARIASGLHVGSISISLKDRRTREAFLTAVIIGVLSYVLLGVILYYFAHFFLDLKDGVVFSHYILVIFGAGLLLVFTLCLASVFTAFWSFKKGYDPDDFVAPVVTTIGDVFGILFLLLFLSLIVL